MDSKHPSGHRKQPANTAGFAGPAGRVPLLASRMYTGRTRKMLNTQVDFLSSRIQMLSLATQCRQYTTIRLPRSQGSLPVASLTTFTLWARTIHTLLAFSPQDRITSIAPLLRMRPPSSHMDAIAGRKGYATALTVSRYGAPGLVKKEREIEQLAQSPETISKAVEMYRNLIPVLPFHSLTPWMLLCRCYAMQSVVAGELEWLVNSLGALHCHGKQEAHELLLLAYIRLGQDRPLREQLRVICTNPKHISANTLALVLAELQNSTVDRQLACNLWESLTQLPEFSPSQTGVQLILKIALHARKVDFAASIYQHVLSQKWESVRSGLWAEKTMVYGLAINGMANEAFEVATATTNMEQLGLSRPYAIQTIHKYELLLNGLSKARMANEAEAVFMYIREELGLLPSVSMYSSLLGVVATACDSWDVLEQYLNLMEADGYSIPETIWKRIMLGVAKQGRVDLCDHVLQIMVVREIPFTYTVVLAAIEAFAQQGSLEMVMRWYHVVYKALEAQSGLNVEKQRAISVDATYANSRMKPHRAVGNTHHFNSQGDVLFSIQNPEDFTGYFIERNELIWHRGILVSLIDIVNELGDAASLMQMWEGIFSFRKKVWSLKMSPYVFMALSRSLARHRLLKRYEPLLCSWIKDEGNRFSYSQQEEALGYVSLCKSNYRPIVRRSNRMRAAITRNMNEDRLTREESSAVNELDGNNLYSYTTAEATSSVEYDGFSSTVDENETSPLTS
ncbi:hypothetical protein GGI07_005036 [Coemansia sp. Benny D115]|nr:hypothetical protein GGI07_005036 [Coemansia sp. Benny D115]